MNIAKLLRIILVPHPESRAWTPIFTSIATLISVVIVNVSGVSQYWTFVIAPALAGAFIALFDVAIGALLNSYRWRLRFDSRSKFEGVWFEIYKYDDKLIYAGFSVKYTGNKEEPYIIKGDAYTSDGKSHAEWRSLRTRFNVIANKIDYFYVGRLLREEIDVKGFAHFSFSASPGYLDILGERKNEEAYATSMVEDKTIPHSGSGFLVDDTPSGVKKSSFFFIRMTTPIMEEVLGECIICKNFEIERKFVIEFHRKYGKFIIDNDYLFMTKFGMDPNTRPD